MAVSSKLIALGDVILSEEPRHYCRCDHEVTRDLNAIVGLVPGQAMDFSAGAVAAIQTITCTAATILPDAGTYRLGYKGFWTTALAAAANIVAINAALDIMVVLSGGVAGDLVFNDLGAEDQLSTLATITALNTMGNIEDVVIDARLLTDAGVPCQGAITVATTQVGELTTMKEWATTGTNIDSILLEPVSLIDLQTARGTQLKRSFLTRGPATVNADAITCPAGTVADLVTTLLALTPSIIGQREATMTNRGTPRV